MPEEKGKRSLALERLIGNKERLIVMRFGGSSVKDPASIKKIVSTIARERDKRNKIVVVVSAIPSEREETLAFVKQLSSDPDGETLNNLIWDCDDKPARYLSIALKTAKIPSSVISGPPIRVKLTEVEIDSKKKSVYKIEWIEPGGIARIKASLKKNEIVICSGFRVVEDINIIDQVVLRDSNALAVVLANYFKADICRIYTSTDGIFMADPRIVPNTKRLEVLSYNQMRSFASMGARIFSHRCVCLAESLEVIIHVLLSPALGENTGGTIIGPINSCPEREKVSLRAGLAVRPDVVQLQISAPLGVKIDEMMIYLLLKDICIIDSQFSADDKGIKGRIILFREDLDKAIKRIRRRIKGIEGVEVQEILGLSSLTIVDLSMAIIETAGCLLSISETLSGMVVSSTSSGNAISVIVRQEDMEKAAQKLAKAFKLTKS